MVIVIEKDEKNALELRDRPKAIFFLSKSDFFFCKPQGVILRPRVFRVCAYPGEGYRSVPLNKSIAYDVSCEFDDLRRRPSSLQFYLASTAGLMTFFQVARGHSGARLTSDPPPLVSLRVLSMSAASIIFSI